MSTSRWVWLVGVLSITAARAERPQVTPRLPISDILLANGLRVILAPDPSVVSVVVEVRYGTGTADQGPSRVGFAHVLERLMFAGSVHVPDFEARIEGAGGWSSSVTTADHISVFEQTPSGALALVLWLEAERMAGIADAIDGRRLAEIRAAIAAERRSAYEDQPTALVPRAVQQALWPSHPNHDLVLDESIGSPAVTADFAREVLVPGNAILVIAGRFDPGEATQLVTRYFGWNRATAALTRNAASAAVIDRPMQRTVDDPLPKVVVAFRAPSPSQPELQELEVAGRVLAGGRGSRLWRRLVDAGLASEVHCDLIRQRRGSELRIQATARTGTDPDRLAEAIDQELAALRAGAPSAEEVVRAEVAIEAELVTGLQGLAFRADSLAAWAAYTGRADALETIRASLHAITATTIIRAANTWLRASAEVTVVGRVRTTP